MQTHTHTATKVRAAISKAIALGKTLNSAAYTVQATPTGHPDSAAADLLAATVDRLADIKAQIATLQAEEAELKNDLTESGAEAIEGTLHRAAITYGSTRTTTNWQAVAQHLKPSRQLIQAHTTTGQPFDIVRIGAKKTS